MLNYILNKDVDAVLSAIGAKNLSEKEKTETMEQVLDHFSKIITDASVAELDDEQIKEFNSALNDPDAEEKIANITTHVPGLMKKIEDAVEQEFLSLRSAKEKMSQ